MDPRPIKMFGAEAGKPSPMIQKIINARRSQPHRKPKKALSSDQDTGGGVSLLPSRPTTPAVATTAAATTTAPTPDGHGPGQQGSSLSAVHQQSAADNVSTRSSDHDSSSNDSTGGVQLKPTAKPFNTITGQSQETMKSSITSNLTASAKSFVPQTTFDAKNAPSAPTTTTPLIVDKSHNNKHTTKGHSFAKRTGKTNWRAKTGNSTTSESRGGNNSTQGKASESDLEGAFANQFEDSSKLMDLMKFSEDEVPSTPRNGGGHADGSGQPLNTQQKNLMTPSSVAASSPARGGWGSGPTSKRVLDTINTSTSQAPPGSFNNRTMGQQQQQQAAAAKIPTPTINPIFNEMGEPTFSPQSQPQWGGSRLMNQMDGSGNKNGLGQGHPVAQSGAQNNWGRHYQAPNQLSPENRGVGGGNPNANHGYAHQQMPGMAKTKASDQDLADVKKRLMNFANGVNSTQQQASPPKASTGTTTTTTTNITAPTGYRAGLPGSASESALNFYANRNVAVPAPAPATPNAKSSTASNSNSSSESYEMMMEMKCNMNGGDIELEQKEEKMRMMALHDANIKNNNGNVQPTDQQIQQQFQQMYSPELNELIGPSDVPMIARLRGHAFPFEPTGRVHVKRGEGVVHYVNIPFDLDISSLMAHLGKSSKILHPVLEGCHITMENVTGKTCEAYVEMITMKDSMDVVDRYNRRQNEGHVDRLGDRPVEMAISSPDALLQAVFKTGSTGVEWRGGNPMIKEPPVGQRFGHFKEFVPAEDLTMLIKHAETQTTFSKQCPERPYECLISILVLMPWNATEHITIKTRAQIYAAVIELLKLLQKSIAEGKFDTRLTPQLRNRLAKAAMLCPGFTPLMKDNVAALAGISEQEASQAYNQPRGASAWLHQYGIGVKLGAPLDVLEYYIALIREETTRAVDELPMGERLGIQKMAEHTNGYWGYFWRELNYPVGPDFDNMTLAEAARRELNTIDAILQRAVVRQQNGGYLGAAGPGSGPGPGSPMGHQQQQGRLGYRNQRY